jgi:3-oxoacyl-[acyl-carrier protein] reductase
MHYRRGADEVEAVVVQITRNSGRADAVFADLSSADGVHGLAAQVRSVFATRLDILVTNVGLYKAASIEDTTVNDFDELFPVNVCAPFFL